MQQEHVRERVVWSRVKQSTVDVMTDQALISLARIASSQRMLHIQMHQRHHQVWPYILSFFLCGSAKEVCGA